MGSGASHESATAAVAAGVSELDIAAHLAALEKKPVTVFYNPGSSNSLSCAILGSSIGCAELKVIQLTGEQKGPEFVAVNPYGQVPGMTDGSLNLGESTAILRYLAQQYKPSLYPGTIAERARIDMARGGVRLRPATFDRHPRLRDSVAESTPPPTAPPPPRRPENAGNRPVQGIRIRAVAPW